MSPRNQQKAQALGLTSATGLVIGSIIGTGVFAMPAVLASAGTSSLLALGVIAIGATLLAIMFGQLTKRVPNSDGGLYAYARHEFGGFAGYLTGWCYWIQCWAGNAAIVSAWVFYVDYLFGIHPSSIGNWGIALVGLWVPAIVNLAGVKQMAWFQNLTVVLKFLPLLFVGVVGWFFVSGGNFGAFNASGGSLYDAIGIAAGVALFSFIGVEVAAITAKRVRNPERNVGRASVLGTLASAVLYIMVTAAIMGLVPHHTLVGDTAPFATAFQAIFTHGAWAGKLVAALAVVSGIGALNGWTLVTTEVSRAAAQAGLFPKIFAWADHKDTAWFGILMAALLPSLLMLWSYTTATGLKVFTYLVAFTVVTVAIPYLFSACGAADLPGVQVPPGAELGAGPGPRHRWGRRAVLDMGHLRRRLPGRVSGAGGRPRRGRRLRLPQGTTGAGRPGHRAAGQPATATRTGHARVTPNPDLATPGKGRRDAFGC
jgi:basic amino acid/polyamine antiporter, APA family